MCAYKIKHIPDVVYFDTNVLRSVGHKLNKPWLNELQSVSSPYGIMLCTNELVLDEWTEYIDNELIQKNYQKLLSSVALLKDFNIETPNFTSLSISLPNKIRLKQFLKDKLVDSGFEIIENWTGDTGKLIEEAVGKRSPFERGGKGFCDTIILESFISHALKISVNPRVLVVTRDNAVKNSKERFVSRGIDVTFVEESEVVNKVKSLLDSEQVALVDERDSKLKKYVLSKEKDVMRFVEKMPISFTDWWLQGSCGDKDRIDGTIQKVLSAKPVKITDVVSGISLYSSMATPELHKIKIFVEMELEVEIQQSNILGRLLEERAVAQPGSIEDSDPLMLQSDYNLEMNIVIRKISRKITVEASLVNKVDDGGFENIKLERVI